jgi:hypothetical protein
VYGNLYGINHVHSFFFVFSFWGVGCLVINGVEMGKYVNPIVRHDFYNFVLPSSFHKKCDPC